MYLFLTALFSITQSNQKAESAKLQYEVDELQRRADAAKMKLTAEMKVGNTIPSV